MTEACCIATIPNLLDTSSKDLGNRSKTHPNLDTNVNAKRRYFWKTRPPSIRNDCLLPLIVLIMLCSVVNGDPPTALTSGLLNTAATGDTTISGTSSFGHTSHTMTGMPQSVYVGMSRADTVAGNMKIFKQDLSLACMATTGISGGRALVIKGPGKVFAGSQSTGTSQLYTISNTAGTYAIGMTSSLASVTVSFACGDDDSTNNYAYVMSSTMINKIDLTTGAESPSVSTANTYFCAAGPSANYVVITGASIYIRLKTDLTLFGTATRSVTTAYTTFAMVDNLTPGMLYYITTTYQLAKANLNTATSTTITETMVWSVGGGFGGFDRPLNFGPYQYVVTLTLMSPTPSLLVIDKTNNSPAVKSVISVTTLMA